MPQGWTVWHERPGLHCPAQWALPQLSHRWEGYRRVRRQICRRLAARIDALGLADMPAYRRRVEEDPAEWTALRATLRVTVSRFSRAGARSMP
ncbi:hypothetical protein [Nitrosospira multiformis]|uniref:hypothetical protein n=1 Tax=Nitrosospira multiformis TaxID=1231 RepID=UPI001587E79A|nr:hypothetical protein [Nitrosospira multiformis]